MVGKEINKKTEIQTERKTTEQSLGRALQFNFIFFHINSLSDSFQRNPLKLCGIQVVTMQTCKHLPFSEQQRHR